MPRPAAAVTVVFHFRCDIKSDVNMPLFSIRLYINVTYLVTANTFDSLHKKLTSVALLLVNVRLSLQEVRGPDLKRPMRSDYSWATSYQAHQSLTVRYLYARTHKSLLSRVNVYLSRVTFVCIRRLMKNWAIVLIQTVKRKYIWTSDRCCRTTKRDASYSNVILREF